MCFLSSELESESLCHLPVLYLRCRHHTHTHETHNLCPLVSSELKYDYTIRVGPKIIIIIIGFLFEWEVGRKMMGKKPRSKHIHAEKKAFHWPHIPSSLFSSYKGESESCGGIQINAGERSGEVV